MSSSIRVKCLVNHTRIPVWINEALLILGAEAGIEIGLVVDTSLSVGPTDTVPLVAGLRLVYDKLVVRPSARRDSMARVDVPDDLVQTALYLDFVESLSEDDFGRLSDSCDLLIVFGPLTLDKRLPAHLSSGVLQLCLADTEHYTGRYPGFWEVYENRPVTGASLILYSSDYPDGVIIDKTWSTTIRRSPKENCDNLVWKSPTFVVRGVRKVLSGQVSTALAAGVRVLDRLEQPSLGQQLIFLARNIGEKLQQKMLKRRNIEQWTLMFSFDDSRIPDLSRFHRIDPPVSEFWADPFVITRHDRHYIFFELYPYKTRRGCIAYLEIFPDGSFTSPERVIIADYHLSYPYLIEFEGELLMIPESAENGTIDAYRCTRFPDEWEHAATLMKGVKAYDASLIEHDGLWWMFVNLVETDGVSTNDELFLFFADSPLSESWMSHPLNPIVSDARNARPGGKIVKMDGQIYRPAQNCSFRYGQSLNINLISELTVRSFFEETVGKLLPLWENKMLGVHTWSKGTDFVAMDAERLTNLSIGNRAGQQANRRS